MGRANALVGKTLRVALPTRARTGVLDARAQHGVVSFRRPERLANEHDPDRELSLPPGFDGVLV
jgi:hypothetical protein